MAYVPNSGSVVAFQSDPAQLQASVTGIVGIRGVPSISGTVNVGNQSGSVVAFQGTNPWVVTPTGNQSVSGTVDTRVIASVATVIIGGSIAASFTPPANQSVSGTVGASIIGLTPVAVTNIPSISGTVLVGGGVSSVALVGANTVSVVGQIGASIIGTVPVTQSGIMIVSVVGSYAEDAAHTTGDPGVFVLGIRNDLVASITSANLDYTSHTVDSAGRSLIKPFAADETRIDYVGSVVSGSVTLIAASVIGKRNYITDFFVANTGSVSTLITFQDGSASVLGYTIAPGGGGSNAPGQAMPMRTAPSQDLAFKMGTATSVLYMTVKGYQAP